MHKEVQVKIEIGGGAKPRTKDIIFNDKRIRVYSVGWFSYLTFLAQVTLRKWEREGILPRPFFKLAGANRWYSPAELMLYTREIQAHYQTKDRDLKSLRQKLADLSVQIRKDYTKKVNLPDAWTKLSNEDKIQKTFETENFKDKLSKENYEEVMSKFKQDENKQKRR
jgi:DNA-binding transcriptional MerR regulator